MGKLGDALRKKYRTPKEAISALGLDESLLAIPRLALDGAKRMPTRLEYLLVTRTASAVNPLLALDKKVELGPIFKGVTMANFKERKPTMLADLQKALQGNTIAKDASVEHLAHMLDQFEHVKEPKSLDESVSGEQHRAMEAAAHGHSNLGIPQEVGKEFEEKDKGKTFGDMIRDWAMSKDWTAGMTEDDFGNLEKMHKDCKDEMPENALDESEEEKKRKEEEERKKDEDAAKDKHAMDERLKGMVTQDAMNAAIQAAVATANANSMKASEAREFVRPYVGDLPMALDSAEKIERAAAKALNIEGADTIHASALRTLIKTCARPAGARESDFNMALDTAASGADSFAAMFPDAARIKAVG